MHFALCGHSTLWFTKLFWKDIYFFSPFNRHNFILKLRLIFLSSKQELSWVTKSCPTLCNPMGCSMPGFPVLHYLLEFVQTHVHWVQPSNHLILCQPFLIQNQSFVPCPVVTVASWPAYRFLKRQVRWSGIPISFRIFHSLLWMTQSKAFA